MQGLMQATPLSLDMIFRRAESLWGTKSLATAVKGGVERIDYATWAKRTRKLGGVLEDLGVSADGRVATFAWNSTRHLELYFAAPCTGRVLHTLNIRLFAEMTAIENVMVGRHVRTHSGLIGAVFRTPGFKAEVGAMCVIDMEVL